MHLIFVKKEKLYFQVIIYYFKTIKAICTCSSTNYITNIFCEFGIPALATSLFAVFICLFTIIAKPII